MKMMIERPIPPRDIPDWFLEAVRVMQDIDRELRNMETELRYGLRLKDLDPGLRDDLEYVRDTLGAVKISLSIMDVTARQVLSDLAKPELAKGRLAAA